MNHRPTCKHKIIKLLEDNIEGHLNDHRFGGNFLDATPKV